MASIEKRSGKRGISYRVTWRVDGRLQHETFDDHESAKSYKRIIETAGGDQAKADEALLNAASSAPLLSEVAEQHISRLIDATPYTMKKYRQCVRIQLAPLDIPVDQINEDAVTRWVAWMRHEAHGGKGYSSKTIKNAHGLLHSVLAFAVKRGHRADNPATDTRLPRTQSTGDRDKFLTKEEVLALLPHVAETHQPAIWFLFATGLRVGEMLALTPEDFTVSRGVTWVRVEKSMKEAGGDGKSAYIGEPKTPRSRRTIDVDDATMELVWPLVRSAGHGNPVFPAGPVRLADRFGKIAWMPAMKRAQAAGFTKSPKLHALRHSHVAHLLSLGMSMHLVSWRLGHSGIQVTIDRYGHLVPAGEGASSELFGQSIGSDLSRALAHPHSPAALPAS